MSNKKESKDAKESKSAEGKFKEGGLCWAGHGPLIYLAKILKTKKVKHETHLYVHYLKWNKKWDTWVNAAEAMEDCPATVEYSKKLQAIVKQDKENKKRKSSSRRNEAEELSGDEQSTRKRKAEGDVDPTVEPEEDEDSGKGQNLCLKLPGQIKKELITDWEAITKHQKIPVLPRPAGTVSTILADYQKAKEKTAETAEHEEMCHAIKVYFDRALPFILLYNEERDQFKALAEANKDVVASEQYGAEHLARLFVKFPELLAHTQLTTSELGLLQPKLADFLKWFAKNPKYFGKHYLSTTAA